MTFPRSPHLLKGEIARFASVLSAVMSNARAVSVFGVVDFTFHDGSNFVQSLKFTRLIPVTNQPRRGRKFYNESDLEMGDSPLASPS